VRRTRPCFLELNFFAHQNRDLGFKKRQTSRAHASHSFGFPPPPPPPFFPPWLDSTRVSWILGVFQHCLRHLHNMILVQNVHYLYCPSPLCLPPPPPPPPPPCPCTPLLFRTSVSASSLCAMSKPSSAPPASESSLPDATREEFLLHKAGQHSRQRRFDLALQDCEELLHLDGTHPQALRIKACVNEAHQEWGKAAYSYLEGLAGSPEDPVLRQGFDTALALIRTQSPKAQIKASGPTQPPLCENNFCSISGFTCGQGQVAAGPILARCRPRRRLRCRRQRRRQGQRRAAA
jgi:hypothetical protein